MQINYAQFRSRLIDKQMFEENLQRYMTRDDLYRMRDDLMRVLNEQTVILKRLDRHRVLISARLDRHETDIDRLKQHVHLT